MNLPMADILTLVPIIILIGILFYFSNKEIEKSLIKSREVQELLSQDREELRKKLHEERLLRLHELEKAAEFGRLSQGLFHDLISPLTSIILHTENLKGERTAQHVEKAIDASKRMAVYIKDIRSTLQKEEEMRLCSIKEELESTLRIFSYLAREKKVEIQVKATNNCTWTGSPTKLRQLFSNLISNALDSFDPVNDHRNKIISIHISKSSKNILSIRDNGCGIPEENLSKIFDPFFTTKPHDKGTGIGLTTVKNIVEKDLHGSLHVESELGLGTIITIKY
jgi:signal transduction histidine kinase